jgi:hypothetical protein
MRRSVVVLVAMVLVGAVWTGAPGEAIDRAQVQAKMEEARMARAEMKAAPTSPKAGKAILVRCDKGESVQEALDKNPGPVTIEIQGICAENVRMAYRGDVVLRGKSGDPALDGLQGDTSLQAYTLEVWYTFGLELRDLSFSNGRSGAALHRSDAAVVNCQFSDNLGSGLWLDRTSVNGYVNVGHVTNLVASLNGGSGVILTYGSVLQCQTCQMHNNGGFGASVFDGSFATFWNSEITGTRGIRAWGGGSYVDVDCDNGSEPERPCALVGTIRAGLGINGGDVAAYGTSVEGPFRAENDGASAALTNSQLTGQMYARDGSLFIFASQISGGVKLEGRSEFLVSGKLDDAGNISVASTFGPATLSDWTRATFGAGTVITNPVQCVDAADALNKGALDDGAVSVTGCPHWTP